MEVLDASLQSVKLCARSVGHEKYGDNARDLHDIKETKRLGCGEVIGKEESVDGLCCD
jgi:hypothetical protein